MTVVEVAEAIYYHLRTTHVSTDRCSFKVHPTTLYDLRRAGDLTGNIMSFHNETFAPFLFGVPIISDQTVPERVIRLEKDGTFVVAGRYS